MKWLIIGTSYISSEMAKAMNNVGETAYAILSRNIEKANQFAKENKIKRGFDDYSTAIKYVDAVYIASPNTIHYDQAVFAIKNKKHVLIEKPMTSKYEETKHLYELAETNGVKIMEAYAHITQPIFRKIKVIHGSNIKANLMNVSSKIKNNTFEKANSFSKDAFGGAIPDLGVYPISLFIDKLGKIKSYDVVNKEYLNGVLIDATLKLVHENGTSESRISKIHNGNNHIYINGKQLELTTSGFGGSKRMEFEVEEFISEKNLSHYKNVSLEVAKFLEAIGSVLFKQN